MAVEREREREASTKQEQLMKKVKDLMEKVNESETARAKVEKEAASLKTNYGTAMRQLVEANVAAKKALKAQWVLMEKKYRAWEEGCRSQ